MTTMTQCRLVRHDGAIDIAFIETKFAKEGRVIDLKIDGEWDRGWRVMRVGSTRPAEEVRQRERDYRTHRKATDV